MSNHSLHYCFDPELETAPDRPALERVRYFPRQLLTAEDMRLEQDYFRQKLRRHNRFLHGWGVVCGLTVAPDSADDAPPWQVVIEPGYALGPYGDEIYVADPVHLDLAQCIEGTSTDPCEPSALRRTGGAGVSETLYIAIRYAECNTAPVRAMPEGCACSKEACEYSRIRDSFEIQCLGDLPASHLLDRSFGICEGATPPCPPCPDDPWVVLARITLPTSRDTPIAAGNSQMSIRRQIYSTAVLQQELIRCCCTEPAPQDTVRVTRVAFVNNDNQEIAPEDGFDQPFLIDDRWIGRIQVVFSQPVNNESIFCWSSEATDPDQCSLLVERLRNTDNWHQVPGSCSVADDGLTVIFQLPTTHAAPAHFEPSLYRLGLFGSQDTDARTLIRSSGGSALDGELQGTDGNYSLPSGNGEVGGNFEFLFEITPGPA